ncbi:hydrogenase subunit MbhD domain-containing protein [Streptomyces sp. enrichment culture]|uniref:hydrogenase subunit MbhD domain-containing protein n=1 Tax=Streptomyces sp. enrichment culture TaxID=1795815 RepID=UPI003F57E86C
MTEALIVTALLLVAGSATAAVAVRDPVRQSLVLAVLGVVLAVLFTVLQAPDVALSQLAVGSALTPLLLLLTVRKVRRRGQRAAGGGGGSDGRRGGGGGP